MLTDFYRLGIDEFYPISAQHGLGVDELLTIITRYFPAAADDKDDQDTQIKIAIVGKPNVGKSSLVNRILGKERSIATYTRHNTRRHWYAGKGAW